VVAYVIGGGRFRRDADDVDVDGTAELPLDLEGGGTCPNDEAGNL
jgi:hypothetical protein